MAISYEHVGWKISAKIKIYILSRVKLLCSLCHEIPSTSRDSKRTLEPSLIYYLYQNQMFDRHLEYMPIQPGLHLHSPLFESQTPFEVQGCWQMIGSGVVGDLSLPLARVKISIVRINPIKSLSISSFIKGSFNVS